MFQHPRSEGSHEPRVLDLLGEGEGFLIGWDEFVEVFGGETVAYVAIMLIDETRKDALLGNKTRH
jgi:hypothetical protein